MDWNRWIGSAPWRPYNRAYAPWDWRAWLDFGGLHDLPAEEFFGVAHWQLFKGIDAPYNRMITALVKALGPR